jgi:hypothetical protein
MHWEPLVRAGRLNLRYQASPTQWAEGLTFGTELERTYRCLTWVTPFDLKGMIGPADDTHLPAHRPDTVSPEIPTLPRLLNALLCRLRLVILGRSHAVRNGEEIMNPEERCALQRAMEQADHVAMHSKNLQLVPKNWPGRWRGTQVFASIPPAITPYLELVSILHVGRQTHFGCGTFMLREHIPKSKKHWS